MMRLSIFDVDRTITRRPTYSLFLLHAMLRLAPWRMALLPLMLPLMLLHAGRLMSRRSIKQAMHRLALGNRLPRDQAERVAESFARQLYESGLYRQAKELIKAERVSGRIVALATAAPALYIEPLARHLGIDLVIATQAHWQDGALTCRIAGENCYGTQKLERIIETLENHGITREGAHIRFFSDHASDRPVCEWADESYAVNPSPRMAALARARGWQILDWRRG